MDFKIDELPIVMEGADIPGTSSQLMNISDTDSEYSDEDIDDEEDDKPGQSEGQGSGHTSRRSIKRAVSKLPVHLKGLMGEANLRYARGDHEIAKKMCFEVIRQAPNAHEPYLTLSQMYENVNLKKYHGYLMLACHLYPQDISAWCRLAEVKLQIGQLNEAILCYSQGLKYNPKSIELHQKRLELVKSKGDSTLRYQLRMAKCMPKKQHETLSKFCMEIAKNYHDQHNYRKAIEALEIPIQKTPENIPRDLLNMLLELLILNENYMRCLELLNKFCGFEFDIFIPENEKDLIINSYVLPENLQVDLKVKFIICIIKLKAFALLPKLIDSMLIEDDVERMGDLYLDVVEALMIADRPNDALKLLVPLVKSKNFSLAAVWLKYAECLNNCEMYEQAVEAYFTVMALAPQHIEVLYPLAMLLLKQNKKQEALEVLSQDLTANKIDVAVLIERMKLLKQINELDEYFKCAEILLSRHCIMLKHPEEKKIVTSLMTPKEKIAKVKKMRIFRGDFSDVESDYVSIREPTIEEEYKVYREVLQHAKDTKQFTVLQKLAFSGLSSRNFQKMFYEIYLVAYYSCLFIDDNYYGFTAIRDLVIRYPSNHLCWNWFALILQNKDDVRHIRFLERHPRSKEVSRVIDANYNVSVGNYLLALTAFVRDYKQTKSAFSLLMLGIIWLHLYSQRNFEVTKNKIMAETVTYLFLKYSMNRSKYADQEVFYNLGRMYHQLGVMYLAEHYYKKVLETRNELLDKYPEILSLNREAAYNLHLIYKNSGNFIAARNILMKHIVIE